MESNNWSAAQGRVRIPGQVMGGDAVVASPGTEAADWRTQLQPATRPRIVNKIMETLKRHLPFSGLQEINEIAVRFEEKIYTVATSQSDYLRKIVLKMLIMDSKSQNPTANSLQPNAASNNIGTNPQDHPGIKMLEFLFEDEELVEQAPTSTTQQESKQELVNENDSHEKADQPEEKRL